ncbi:MAG: hypothetical protein IJ371_05710 [Clostridia bacterium]|nr:hypothetical protein [Clostridia bacterium]
MSNEIVKKEENKIQINNEMSAMLSEEMEGLNIAFPIIKVPAGGGLAFEVPGDDPNSPDLQKEFNAVILYHHPMLSYYKEKYTGGNQAPDCGSYDGINGIDRESGEIRQCKDCPLNQFGSGENGGKACKTKRRIFLLRENEAIPTILTLPTGSIGDFSKYIMRLVTKGKKSNHVVTKFSLAKAQNSGGINYSKVVLTQAYELSPVEVEQVSKMSEQVKLLASKQDFTEVEVEE